MQKKIFLYLLLVFLVGCRSIGPLQVQMDRGAYNNIVRDTEQEQLLMNIVRGRYLEISQYIQIGSLTASYSLSRSITATGGITESTGPGTVATSLTPTVSYSDTPTISYLPLSNIDFAKSLMTPVSMQNFLLLAHAGNYDHTMLFSLFFEQIGDIDSDLLNRDGTSLLTSDYEKFNYTLGLLNKLLRAGAFKAPRAVVYQKRLGGILSFNPRAVNSPDALKLKKILGIPLNSKQIIFIDHSLLEELEEKNGLLDLTETRKKPRNIVYVRLRSIYAIINLLGRGVDIPCRDIEAHLTRELLNSNGTRRDWGPSMRHIITIYSSERMPRNDVLVRVVVHNHWFYIKASDLISKDTFDAVMRVSTLTSAVAAANNNQPVLTIPVTSVTQ